MYALEEYEQVIGACSTAFAVLNQRLESLNLESLDKHNGSSFKAKLNAVWNDDEVGMLRQNIRGQAIAITLLLSTFQADTSAKTYQLLRESKNQAIFQTVSDDARTLLSKSSRARTFTQRTVDHDVESSESVLGNDVFDFDDLIINSTAYRRAYHRYNSHAAKEKQPVDTKLEESREEYESRACTQLEYHT
ncbi:uncharacterized protein LY89DRAFT_19937 [Mollisia scopiformis]|uniref:Uncharacterized protein n=1 Tax=Mollisia scopiformis TaxID=149040 RepID=A0A194XVL7_MOLSC|nr:uncharacterized protein LY89DRAFT_19937 [Mollisia scopiformis]KUJ24375.1 hypothetical protein LY89DRAFT_19937 [Mollisia scopiformis]